MPLEGDTVAAAGDGAGTAAARAGARVQLVFDQPVFVVPGDRFILRNAQGTRTVGGGASVMKLTTSWSLRERLRSCAVVT